MLTVLQVSVLALAFTVSGCNLTFEPVNLNAAERPSAWADNYRGGRVSPPAGR
ncbi:hypothetical protein H0I76_01205 [Limibaculum sp. M0105]|uniref:Uncharacterized protein n=1 Tax=Thermohalobaculum xanthum TaxID=2753746 RepID=A0A8J7M3Z8_9RHOB|nr:hypothetical protein [Thermohalobaculum xanthum]MBK0397793.1 hypothetical protein [Thermohalobaculum xanthum]